MNFTFNFTPPSSAKSSVRIVFISRLFWKAQLTWNAVLQAFTEHWMQAPHRSLHRQQIRDQRLACQTKQSMSTPQPSDTPLAFFTGLVFHDNFLGIGLRPYWDLRYLGDGLHLLNTPNADLRNPQGTVHMSPLCTAPAKIKSLIVPRIYVTIT